MRLLLGMLRPDTGTAEVWVARWPTPAGLKWSRVGHLIETPPRYGELTVAESVYTAARLQGWDRRSARVAADAIITDLELEHWQHRATRTLSLGNRQRLGIAMALVHRPDVLVLDEPSNSLDPLGVVRVRQLLRMRASAVGKSATTRARLQREALRLFADRGYDETTVADIAAAAGVTQMTFFRYFPAKELVVVDDPYDPAIAHSVAVQATDLPVVERVRRGLLAAWEQLEDADDAEFRLRLRIGAGHRGLRARMRENNVRTEAAIAAALTDAGVPAFEAVVAAAAVIGALTAALLEWANDPDAGPMGDAVTAALALLEVRPLR